MARAANLLQSGFLLQLKRVAIGPDTTITAPTGNLVSNTTDEAIKSQLLLQRLTLLINRQLFVGNFLSGFYLFIPKVVFVPGGRARN
jgi:hypothetical protein